MRFRRNYRKRKVREVRNLDDPRYKKWRKEVYLRDKRKCQMPGCVYRGRKIEAHHIVRWADSIPLRFEKTNGICLCWRCHKRVTGHEDIYAPLFKAVLEQNEIRSKEHNPGQPRARRLDIPEG